MVSRELKWLGGKCLHRYLLHCEVPMEMTPDQLVYKAKLAQQMSRHDECTSIMQELLKSGALSTSQHCRTRQRLCLVPDEHNLEESKKGRCKESTRSCGLSHSQQLYLKLRLAYPQHQRAVDQARHLQTYTLLPHRPQRRVLASTTP